jgi:hypothetical protein
MRGIRCLFSFFRDARKLQASSSPVRNHSNIVGVLLDNKNVSYSNMKEIPFARSMKRQRIGTAFCNQTFG